MIRRLLEAFAPLPAPAAAPVQQLPDPETLGRLLTLEQSFAEIFKDRERYAKQINDLIALLGEQDHTIALLQNQIHESEIRRQELTISITERVKEIGRLEAQHAESNRSRVRFGERIGELESQVQYLTGERARAATIAQRAQAEVYFLTTENLMLRQELAKYIDLALIDQRLAEIRSQLLIGPEPSGAAAPAAPISPTEGTPL